LAGTDHHARALSLARANQPEQAIVALREHLAACPDDAEAWNDAGVLLHRLGHHHQALTCLERALQLAEDPDPVAANVFDLCHTMDSKRPIGRMVELLHARGGLGVDTILRWVESLLAQDRPGQAIEIVLAASRYLGEGPELQDLACRIRTARPRIAFFCGGDGPTFLRPVLDHLKPRFDIRYFDGNTVADVHKLMAWSTLSWFEWCTELAEIGTAAAIPCMKVARLHRYEAYLDWPNRIRWDGLDVLVTVGNSFVMKHLLQQVPDLPRRTRIVTIPNGVDLDRIVFRNRPPGKNLAFIADVRPVKNPMLMLQCLHRLRSMDPQYRVFWAGRCPDVALDQYMRHMTRALGLETAIQRDGWQRDINEWLKDKHYILCTSTIESQGMGVLEAMAAGLKPVVHNFPGAEETFGSDWLFDTPEQFCDQILSGGYEPQRYRRFVAERYSLPDILDRIETLLDRLADGRLRVGGTGAGSANQVRPATAEAPVF